MEKVESIFDLEEVC